MTTQTQTLKPARTTTRWAIDPTHTLVEFSVRHMMITKVKGRFPGVSGTVEEAGDGTRSTVEVEIDAGSIDTREEKRDAHLRSADFFDVENHPTLAFRSRRVEPRDGGRLRIVGDLTIRGVTREVELDVREEGRAKDPWGGERAGFSATTKLNRKDFGLEWNVALETGGFLVGEEVLIHIEAELVKQD